MNPVSTPNAEALEKTIKIGPFEVSPISLKTIILLERIGSPLVGQSRGPVAIGADGKPLPPPPAMPFTDATEALWVLMNADRPDISAVLGDGPTFARAVNALAVKIDLADMPRIIADLSAAFDAVNKTFVDAGITGEPAEKKEVTGPSAS